MKKCKTCADHVLSEDMPSNGNCFFCNLALNKNKTKSYSPNFNPKLLNTIAILLANVVVVIMIFTMYNESQRSKRIVKERKEERRMASEILSKHYSDSMSLVKKNRINPTIPSGITIYGADSVATTGKGAFSIEVNGQITKIIVK